MDDVASPCTGVCRLDAAGETCLGCRRTIDEIAVWANMDGAGKRRVLARLAALAVPNAVRADTNDPA